MTDNEQGLIAAFDAATNQVAQHLQSLQQKVGELLNSPSKISDQDKQDVQTGFQDQIVRLNGLGQNPDDPIPGVTVKSGE